MTWLRYRYLWPLDSLLVSPKSAAEDAAPSETVAAPPVADLPSLPVFDSGRHDADA